MDLSILINAALMGIVEGLTEFLPISSTGHLILAGSILNFTGETAKVFEIAIQTGAMLAVCWEYRRRLISTAQSITHEAAAQRFAMNVLIAFLPAVVAGLLLGKTIKAALFYPGPVAIALIIGGFIILLIERVHARRAQSQSTYTNRINSIDDMRTGDALKVGLLQCLALIPGTSRSGATIMGAMVLGFSRKAATEFSFFLGIPTLMGAGAYSMWKDRNLLHLSDWPMFAAGTVMAFISALICIRWLICYISNHTFVIFAWYRIIFGSLILFLLYGGWGSIFSLAKH